MIRQLLCLVSLALLGSACAIPHGSYARPATAPKAGTGVLGGGVTVPLAAVGVASADGDTQTAAQSVSEFAFIPAASYDFFMDSEFRSSFGFEVSLISAALSTTGADGDAFGLFINPRYELGLAQNLSIAIDGNLGILRVDEVTLPIISPQFGLRYYVPTGFGGLCLYQGIGTGFVTLFFPGSVSYDFPIPVGSTTLHVFPELRWDPTLLIAGSAGVVAFAFFSGGLSFMLEI